jgi:hypothetical protein
MGLFSNIFKKPNNNLEVENKVLHETLWQIQAQLDHRLMEERSGRLLMRPFTQRAIPPITMAEMFEAMGISRWLSVHSPELRGCLGGLLNYVIGDNVNIELDTDDTFLEAFLAKNDLSNLISREFYIATRDGESFVELVPEQDGIPRIRILDSASIRPPSEQYENPYEWSFGIWTHPDYWDEVKAYSIWSRDGQTNRKVKPQFIFHHKYTDTQHKRSLPFSVSCFTELLKLPELRQAGLFGEIARQSIAFFRVHEYGDRDSIQQIRNFQSDGVAGSVDKPIPAQIIHPGEVVDIPDSLSPKNPPGIPYSKSMEAQTEAAVQAVSAASGVPTWIVGGFPAPGSFASSLTAEHPFIRLIGRQQQSVINRWTKIIYNSLLMAQATGSVNTINKPIITLQEPNVENLLDTTKAHEILFNNNIIRAETFCSISGFNPDEELINNNPKPINIED